MIVIFSFLLFFLIFYIYKFFIWVINNKFRVLLDIPSENRKIHKKAIPTGGGIIFAIIGVIIGYFFNLKILIICFPLALIGLLDDIFQISSKIRFLFQLIISYFLLINSNFINFYFQNNTLLFNLFLLIILLILITGFINFSNFMDGLDGLTIGSFFIIFMYISLYKDIHFLPFTLSLLCFLYFNWPPAKIFMGDAGSTYLGSLFIGLCFYQENLNNAIGLFLLAGPLWADSLITLILRFFNERKDIFKPHKKHLYQRLYSFGMKKNLISLLYIFSTLLNSICLEIFGLIGICSSLLIELMIGFYLNEKFTSKPIFHNKLY